MALRSLDNTLPLTFERPKKAIKVSNSIAKSNPKPKLPADLIVNDENVASLDPVAPVVDLIDYVSYDDLTPLSDPDVNFHVYVFLFGSLLQNLLGQGCVGFGEGNEESKKCLVQEFYHGCF